ncbi:hypothetical protein AB4099_21635 [Bosea sp. 2KB_26]|uniref:hypothetical protein n=1 Tax=Bosea sp. 2KB_26 TaxID=3237475 RepID=UPI003F8E4927
MTTTTFRRPGVQIGHHRIALFCGSFIAAMSGAGISSAQVPDIFRGSTLRGATSAGFVVVTFKRRNDEILKIRANSQTVQPLIAARLPAGNPDRPYEFLLEIGAPQGVRQTCSKFPDSAAEFETCFKTRPMQAWRGWDVLELAPLDGEIRSVGFRSKSKPVIYARCVHVPSLASWRHCEYIFEQGSDRHVLSTSARALTDIRLFRCAALQLRNAVWPDAPPIADLCP